VKCIFCFNEAAATEEHVFPEAIGGSFSIWRLCKKCNDTFGTTVDPLLTNHATSLIHRQILDIRGKRGALPELFTTGTMKRDDDRPGPRTVRIRSTIDPKTGVLGARILPTFQEEVGADGAGTISAVFGDETDLRRWFKKELGRRGILPATQEAFDELYARSVTIGTIDSPAGNYRIDFDLFRFRKALTKIAYELAWHWLGDTWLQDAVAKKMRRVLRSEPKEVLPIRGRMDIGTGEEFFDVIVKAMALQPHEHFGMLMRVENRAAILLTLFNSFFAAVEVSSEADRYGVRDFRDSGGEGILLDARDRSYRRVDWPTMFARGRGALTFRTAPHRDT
jgi:hypothetical protein